MYYQSFKLALLALTLAVFSNVALAGKTYTETEFLNVFGGKFKKVVEKRLGKPAKKQISVKPSSAGSIVGAYGKLEKNKKPVKVEMWYYKNLVKYDAKHTYKETEITFVNDRVMNIGFFNNR